MKSRGLVILSISLICPPVTSVSSSRIARPSDAAAFITRPVRVRGGSDSDVPPYYPPDEETFQDRIDAWKKQQESTYAQQTVEQASSPRDADGRMKLLTTCSKGARGLIFFVLMWRSVHLYEVADHVLKGVIRLLIVVPLMILFIANLAGTVASLTSPSHSAKKRLKAILNLDKLVEGLLIVFNFLRLTVLPSKSTGREVFIANTIHSLFFLMQAQAFTRVTWDEVTLTQTSPMAAVQQQQPEEEYPAYDNSQNYYDAGYENSDYAYPDDGQQNQNYY